MGPHPNPTPPSPHVRLHVPPEHVASSQDGFAPGLTALQFIALVPPSMKMPRHVLSTSEQLTVQLLAVQEIFVQRGSAFPRLDAHVNSQLPVVAQRVWLHELSFAQ